MNQYNALAAVYGSSQPLGVYGGLVQSYLDTEDHAGLYVSADQMIYRPTQSLSQGLFAFYGAGSNQSGKTLFGFYTDGGLSYTGLIPTRKDDVLALGAEDTLQHATIPESEPT